MGTQRSILIVDDDESSSRPLADLVARVVADCRVDLAFSGASGMECIRAARPDLAVIDISLPDANGVDLCRQLKSDAAFAEMPVILVSGIHRSTADRVAGLDAGAEGYLVKPFEAEEMVSLIRSLLRLKERGDALARRGASLQSALDAQGDELRQSRDRFRAIFEASPDALFVEDRDGTVLDANPAACRMHGLPREQIVGRKVTDLVPPGYRDDVARDFPAWFSGDLKVYEGYSYRQDGQAIPVEIKGSAIDYDGRSALLLIVRDISDRRTSEDRQSATLRGLRAVVEIADELIAHPDLDSVYRRAIELARERLGLERCAIMLSDGLHVFGTFGTDMHGETTDERSHRLPLDATWRERFRLRGPQEPRWSLSLEHFQHWSGSAMQPKGQGWVAITPIQTARKAIGVFCNDSAISRMPFDPVKQELVAVYASLIANIVERKLAEAERARLATAVEQSAEAVVICNLNGTITYVNPAFERMSGYSRRDAIGLNPRILKSGRHDAAFYTKLWETLKRGDVWMGRITNRRKDGSYYEAEQTITPLRDGTGEISGYLTVSQDVTQAAQLEAQLRQAQKMDGIGRLAGGLAHDFNNLLTGILGYARVVLDELPPDHALRADVGEIVRAGERAAQLTRQLLSFGNRPVLKIELIDVNDAVLRMDQLLRRTLGENIELATALGEDLRAVEADAGLLEQVVMNLAVNARDAMPRGGKLVLRTAMVRIDPAVDGRHAGAAAGDYVLLSVGDNGTGMSDDVKQRAFEPFFTTKPKDRNIGLGLSTVYGIVRQFRGFIELDSDTETGTEVRIYLPAVLEGAERKPAAVPLAASGDGAATILVVEDESTVRRLIVRNLQGIGYTVIEARHGEEGLQIAAQHKGRIDLVLSDIIMPRMGGVDMALRMKTVRPEARILFMSGYTDDAKFDGVDGAALILKPFTRETLAKEIARLLGRIVDASATQPGGAAP